MESELGVSPVELAQSRRLATARQLLVDGSLPVTEIAFAAGFASLRRFNAVFRDRYGRSPSSLRGGRDRREIDAIELRLDFRPPLAWSQLLGFLGARATPGVERVANDTYARTVVIGDRAGWIDVARTGPTSVGVRIARSLASRLPAIAARVRAVFDLDARPDVVDGHLAGDRVLARRVAGTPGLRLPGAFDSGELAIRAVLGQQVSVRAATTRAGRLAARFGAVVEGAPGDGLDRAFPTPTALAGARLDDVRAIGMPEARAAAVIAIAQAIDRGAVDLEAGADPERAQAALVDLPGIGPWTAAYVAMRALSWPDAFPAGDLVIRRALGAATPRAADARTAGWRPWRAYGVMHLWNGPNGEPT
jgi:AraC family transcriptional regulator of adaptative response / DNA-3-methyladenine glycosylase II